MPADGKALAAAALAPLLLLAPVPPPWSWPIVVVGALWGPGSALLDAAYPRGRCSQLERHALAAGIGLLLLPLVALATSATLGFHRLRLALALLGLACAAALLAAARRQAPRPEAVSFARVPGTRATLAMCGAALLLAAAIAWWPHPAEPVPASLWLEDGDGHALVLPPVVAVNASVPLRVVLASGGTALDGALDLAWDGHGDPTPVHLPAQGRLETPFVLPTQDVGVHTFVARFASGAVVREVHVALRVGGA